MPAQNRYFRTMAKLGTGSLHSEDFTLTLSVNVATFAPVRNLLIAKGMISSPVRGDTDGKG